MNIGLFQKVLLSLRRIVVAVVLCTPVYNLHAGQAEPLDDAVRHLIAHVEQSELTFIRNAGEYTGREASGHMLKKYDHFRERIQTPEEFIELCASRSILSGRPYLVIDRQGREQRTGEWLMTELQAYRDRAAPGTAE